MRFIFVATVFLVLICCPISIGLSQDNYELSNVKAKLVKTGSIGDITKYENFYLDVLLDTSPDMGFREFTIKLLEAKGLKGVKGDAAQIYFICTPLPGVIVNSTRPEIEEGY